MKIILRILRVRGSHLKAACLIVTVGWKLTAQFRNIRKTLFVVKTMVSRLNRVNQPCNDSRARCWRLARPQGHGLVRANASALRAPSRGYLRGRVSGRSVAVRRADGVGDAAVILILALRVRPPGRVAFLNGARLFKPPAVQQISHLNSRAAPLLDPLLCTGNATYSLCLKGSESQL